MRAFSYSITYDHLILNPYYPKVLVQNITKHSDPEVLLIQSTDTITPVGEYYIIEFPFNGFGGINKPDTVIADTDFGRHVIVVDLEGEVTMEYYTSWATTNGSVEDNYLVLNEISLPADPNNLYEIEFGGKYTLELGGWSYSSISSNQPVIIKNKIKFLTGDGEVVEVDISEDNASLTSTPKMPSGLNGYWLQEILWTDQYGILIGSFDAGDNI